MGKSKKENLHPSLRWKDKLSNNDNKIENENVKPLRWQKERKDISIRKETVISHRQTEHVRAFVER